MKIRKSNLVNDFRLEFRFRWNVCSVIWDKVKMCGTKSRSAEADLNAVSELFSFIYKVYVMAAHHFRF